MQLVINGQQVEVENGIKNIEDLLHHFQLQERIVVIEQNGEIVEKGQYDIQPVNDGDRIEIVQFVGGG
ncbi:sulfur carrier protein ThiS [Caldibacillus thermolactis]|jgi:thiamine biosynthesis protein ThiS|uniref:Sulfur carrier protein ThiS n=1 Tax=Pallidibacillus thermolactis TaxID=251051 RepID=A0ABT2WC72_9BACI|nr:sulfur carrier protein ThiS [Pallidibacillus thermolactis]MCU9593275.1 sulfur carrier protein ThiS [Pallidibacillus thermolactis]MCU9600016.1 sulfur carrier protein ThiS [Pallidibacillus thermolactis subsp. kokeshiiformis]MED1673351.1 sulfur carrier protein ThiS [Pallidibacillus thermolactis subsp. kokeshiiformis]